MPRYRVKGIRRDSFTVDDLPSEVLLNAKNRDAAARIADRMLFVRLDSIQEIPDHEGRGPVWRLLRRLGVF